jgi:hypothetical protein
MLTVLLLVSALGVMAQSCIDKNAQLNMVNQYQVAQNALDAKATAQLFEHGAVLNMPVGNSAPIVGRAAIYAAYNGYFTSLTSNNETVMTPIVVSGTIVAYGKNIDVVQATGNSFSAFVVSWFNFTCNPAGLLRVQSLSHAYNN